MLVLMYMYTYTNSHDFSLTYFACFHAEFTVVQCEVQCHIMYGKKLNLFLMHNYKTRMYG